MKRFASFLIIVIAAAAPAAALAQDTGASKRGAGKGWRFEAFGSPAWSLLNASAENAATFDVVPVSPTVSGSRLSSDFGWGAGIRAVRGAWGIEAAYRRIGSKDLTPGYLIQDTRPPQAESGAAPVVTILDPRRAAGAVDSGSGAAPVPTILPPEVPSSRGDLYFGQFFREFRVARSAAVSLGVGGGYLRVTDTFTDSLLTQDWSSYLSDDLRQIAFSARRNSPVYGASLALTTEIGRFLVRPRVDVILPARSLTTTLDLNGVIPAWESTDQAGNTARGDSQPWAGAATTSVRPTLFLVSVEIGFRH